MDSLLRLLLLLVITVPAVAAPDAKGYEIVRDRTEDGPRHRLVHRRDRRSVTLLETTEALEVRYRALGALADDVEGVLVREVLGGSSGDERWSLVAWSTREGRVVDVWRRVLDQHTVLEPATAASDRGLVTLLRREEGKPPRTVKIEFGEGRFRTVEPPVAR